MRSEREERGGGWLSRVRTFPTSGCWTCFLACIFQTSYRESPISQIFGGELLSIVQKQGSKESATVEPFFALPLDIQVRACWHGMASWAGDGRVMGE